MALPFFWQQAFKRSTLLDIETTGLDPTRHAPLGAATKRFGAPVQETWFTYETAERVPRGPWYRKFGIKTEEAIKELMEPFARRQWETSWEKARRAWVAGGGVPQPARKFFSKVLAREARAGRFLWTHNVRFDITQFGSQFAHPAAQRMMYERAIEPGWTKFDPYSGRVYPTTTRTAFEMRSLAYDKPRLAPGAMREWYGSYRQMVKRALKEGKPAVLDSLAIAQSMFGMAQERGMMARTGDIFTGTSIEALATAFGVTGKQAAHLATADTETLERIMPKVVETAERLYKGKRLKGWQAKALRYLGEVQPEIAKRNVERMFAQAVKEQRTTGKYRLRKGGYSKNLDDLVGVYKKFHKERTYYQEGMLEEAMGRIKSLPDSALDRILLERARVPENVSKASQIKILQSEFGAKMRRFLSHRNPFLMAGVAAIGAFAVGSFLLPDREEHNTVTGLKDEGLRGIHRRLATDFGSGYNVDAPRIHPDILLFKQTVWNDEAKRDAIRTEIDKLQKAYQARLGKFRSDEITRVDPSVVPGINARRSDLRLVNMERFKVQVEDADTIFLERRGWLNWLKARMGYGRIAMRLSGVDAPEIAHEDDPLGKMGVRWHADQPHGREARKELKRLVSGDVSIVTTAEPETYGRYIGAIIDEEGANVNLELIRRGAAKALPWGKAEKELVRRDLAADAEAEARDEQAGIWNYARYNVQSMIEDAKNREITFNMLTRLDVLAQRPSMALVASELAGLGEQGIAPYLRHMISDFGSSYQAVMAISKWAVRFEEGATAKFLRQAEVKDLMVYLRSQIKNSQLLRVGRSSFGLEMTDAALKENIAALRKLEAAKGYKGGVMLLKQEHFMAIPDRRMRIEEIKRSVLHESTHSAGAVVPGMLERMRSVVPQNMVDILEIEGYGSVGSALSIAETQVERLARLEEEAAAYMMYPETAGMEGIKAGAEEALRDVARAEQVEELRRMHHKYVTETPVVQARIGQRSRNELRASMKKDTMKKHGPRVVGVRTDDSPMVPGMVQGMHNKRKASHMMYHR